MTPEDSGAYLTGIDGKTGNKIRIPNLEEISALVRERLLEPRRVQRDFDHPDDLSKSGWGVIFAQSDERANAMYEALKPLLDHRKAQAGSKYREFRGGDGYLPELRAIDFLERFKGGPGKADSESLPCYLLLVGSPEQIPYEFQYGLDQQRAVGRLHFDQFEDYKRYAQAVVEAEEVRRPSLKVAFFGPRHDPGTEISNEGLLAPVINSLRERSDCWVRFLLGEGATKKRLKELLTNEMPDLLFTAGHGLVYGSGDECQLGYQGALVCQEWSGTGPPRADQIFSGDDVNGGGSLQGLVTFLFACNSAGAPKLSDFAPNASDLRTVAPRPFVSRLAQRLLGKGALAVIGHVEQVWQCSFLWRTAGYQPKVFAETIKRLLDGYPVGWALEPINQRYTDLATYLCEVLQEHHSGLPGREMSIAELWTACRDARNYVIVGDPAVRLPGKPEKKRVMRGMPG